jgi:hypothetical protein
MTNKPAGWVLLTYGDDRGWGGNSGYEDDPTRLYRYDSFVPNHRQLKVGDVVLVRDKSHLLGIAQIAKIKQEPGQKEGYRCPTCDDGHIGWRSTTQDYRCANGHVFASPAVIYRDCIKYEAEFGASFVPAPGALSIEEMRDACLRYNQQLAMQRLDLSLLSGKLIGRNPAAEILLRGGYIDMHQGVTPSPAENDAGYTPSGQDLREALLRTIRIRRGQQRFRESLRRRYGDACMVSGCTLFDVVEAAHISPFRGDDDHHPENGLLLRADLHTLFDLDLLGIEPRRLNIHLHREALSAGYSPYSGAVLRCSAGQRPSLQALELRWSLFRARSG